MINNRAMPVLLSARRVATHHRSSTPTVNDFAGALVGPATAGFNPAITLERGKDAGSLGTWREGTGRDQSGAWRALTTRLA